MDSINGMKQKINILYILDDLKIGGAQQLVYTLCKHLDKNKFKIVAATLFSHNDPAPEPIADEIRELRIPVYRLPLSSWRDFDTMKKYKALLRKEKINIVHCHMTPADYWGSLFTKIFSEIPSIYTSHNTYIPYSTTQNFQTFLLNRLLSDKIISISDSVYNNLIKNCWAPNSKIKMIFNGIDIENFYPVSEKIRLRKKFNLPGNKFIIGNISRFEKRKGYDIFFKAAKRLLKKDKDIHFIAVGSGENEEQYREYVGNNNMGNNVSFVSAIRDIPTILNTFDIFLFTPYWGEGLPLSVLEAMSSGLPVVASNIGSNPEIITHTKNGFLPAPEKWIMGCESMEIEPFVKTILHLKNNKILRKKIGQNARKTVVENFSHIKMIRQTEELYFSLYQKQSVL